MRILDIIGVPDNRNTALWVENYGTVIIDNMRFGGEGLLQKDLVANRHPDGRIFMRYCWFGCHGGSVIICNESPNLLALTDNLGVPDTKMQILITMGPQAKKDVKSFLFERGNIAPININDLRPGKATGGEAE